VRLGLVYVDALGEGGYPRDVRWLAGHLANLGVTVSLVTKPGPRSDGLDAVQVFRPDELDSLASSLDILHIWGIFLPQQFWISRRLITKSRLVISPMGHLIGPQIRRRWWKKLPYLLAMRPLFARWRAVAHLFSQEELEGARRFLRPVRQFEASLGTFPAPPGAVRAPGTFGDHVLFLGRNDVYQKGMDLLLAGYAAAVEQGLDLPLRIAGQPAGNSTRILRRHIEKLGLSKRVQLLGTVSEAEKWRLLTQARCLAFLSRWDGPPRPIREAIAVGTPVVVTPGTNLAELVEASGAGAAVRFRAEEVARELLGSANEVTAHTWIRGALRLREILSWTSVAKKYLDGYESILSTESPRAARG
jgi:glycosyltransferase involved in cell wall biosynthesis